MRKTGQAFDTRSLFVDVDNFCILLPDFCFLTGKRISTARYLFQYVSSIPNPPTSVSSSIIDSTSLPQSEFTSTSPESPPSSPSDDIEKELMEWVSRIDRSMRLNGAFSVVPCFVMFLLFLST